MAKMSGFMAKVVRKLSQNTNQDTTVFVLKRLLIVWQSSISRAVLVACVFRVVLGGVKTSPPLTQLLGYLATRSQRQSKERQK